MPLPLLHKLAKWLGALLRLCLRLCLLAGLVAFLQGSRVPSALERVLSSAELHIISRNGPTTYYEGPFGFTGFEYELTSAFADFLGVELVVHEQEDLAAMIDAVGERDRYFAAAGLTVTDKREQKVKFSYPYLKVDQKLVYRAGNPRPKHVGDLLGKKLVVIANSSHAENLRNLQSEYPELDWDEVFDHEPVDLLELVQKGDIDYAVIDSNAYEASHGRYPKVRVAFNIKENQCLAWAFPQSRDSSLFDKAQEFLAQYSASGKLLATREVFYGHVREMNQNDSLVFAKRLESRLPRWRDELMMVADEVQMDWRLLAAISYQESHWNPRATSPTGVRGFMMLTLATAEELGVADRLDAMQSIRGGANYFQKIQARIPERISAPDRLWFALAAYNIGYGHLEDARILTEHRGANPDKWADVKEDLLLLSKRKYYKFTKHGYARGWEAVSYVQNIRNFYAIIAWHDDEKTAHELAVIEEAQKSYEEVGSTVTDAVKIISGPSTTP